MVMCFNRFFHMHQVALLIICLKLIFVITEQQYVDNISETNLFYKIQKSVIYSASYKTLNQLKSPKSSHSQTKPPKTSYNQSKQSKSSQNQQKPPKISHNQLKLPKLRHNRQNQPQAVKTTQPCHIHPKLPKTTQSQ